MVPTKMNYKSFAKKRIFSLFLAFVLPLFAFSQSESVIKTVVIDAGHGGKDPGAIGVSGVKEKDVALSVALSLGNKIKVNYPNVKVIYTRDNDVFIGLAERAKIANRASADLFISIHANAAANASAKGTESWVLGLHKSEAALEVAKRENASILMEEDYEATYQDFNPSDPDSYIALSMRQNVYLDQSLQLAQNIQTEFTSKLNRKNRGVKQAGFMVLYRTTMPSVLIELGFLSNKDDETFLKGDSGREKLANSIFKAFGDYKSKLEGVNSSVVIDQPNKESVAKEEKSLKNDIHFRVQIATSTNKVEPVSYNFRGLNDVIVEKVGKYYKYYLGNFFTFVEAQEKKETAKSKGYDTAFIVAYKNGEKVSINEALKK